MEEALDGVGTFAEFGAGVLFDEAGDGEVDKMGMERRRGTRRNSAIFLSSFLLVECFPTDPKNGCSACQFTIWTSQTE